MRLERINDDGTFDPTFTPDPALSSSVTPPVILPNGMLIGFPRSAGEIRIQRYTISGAIDPSYPAYTFSMPYAPGSESASASTDPSGKIYASAGGLLVRLDSDGTRDLGFQPYQIANGGSLMGLQATAAGALLFDQVTTGGPHLYLIGESVTRLGPAGIVDPSYPTLTIPAKAPPSHSTRPPSARMGRSIPRTRITPVCFRYPMARR